MNGKNILKKFRFSIKKTVVAVLIFLIMLIVMGILISENTKTTNVDFELLKEADIPLEISEKILPEYKNMERALACIIEDEVYVIVTRGEKPTTGFELEIDGITTEKKEESENMVVYAIFDDPEPGDDIEQELSYPICVLKTELKKLPDSVELRIEYK